MEKNNITEVVFILDKSGSMSGFEGDVVGGFNATIEKQRKLDGKVYVSTVLFDNESEVVHDRVDIGEIKPMTEEDYRVGGCTALLDAVGGAIRHISSIHKYARPEDVPEHTVFIITTDGMENASRSYSRVQISEMISEKQKKGWEFIFLAANIDAAETAEGIGIRRERAVSHRMDGRGIEHAYEAISEAISYRRCNASLDDGMWRRKVDEDNKKRRRVKK